MTTTILEQVDKQIRELDFHPKRSAEDEIVEVEQDVQKAESALAKAKAAYHALVADGGVEMAEFPQTIKTYAAPTRMLEELVIGGQVHHGGNPVMRWMAQNVVVRFDVNENMRPDRERSREKIDGIVALIMGLDGCMRMDLAPGPGSYAMVLE